MPHHLVSEGDLQRFCIYCKKEVAVCGWKSEWHSGKHYKTFKCTSCGKDLHVSVNFDGSGHDSWNGCTFKSKITKKIDSEGKNIEDKIRIVERTKVLERHYPKGK